MTPAGRTLRNLHIPQHCYGSICVEMTHVLVNEVVRIRTRETICRPEVASLVMRGANACEQPSGAVLAELARDIAADHLGVFVGFSGPDSVPKTVVVACLPTSVFHPAPEITLAYSEDRKLFRATVLGMRDWIVASGFEHALAYNYLHSDRSFFRGFAYAGSSERFASVIRFRYEG